MNTGSKPIVLITAELSMAAARSVADMTVFARGENAKVVSAGGMVTITGAIVTGDPAGRVKLTVAVALPPIVGPTVVVIIVPAGIVKGATAPGSVNVIGVGIVTDPGIGIVAGSVTVVPLMFTSVTPALVTVTVTGTIVDVTRLTAGRVANGLRVATPVLIVGVAKKKLSDLNPTDGRVPGAGKIARTRYSRCALLNNTKPLVTTPAATKK